MFGSCQPVINQGRPTGITDLFYKRDLVNREAAHLRQKQHDFNTVLWKHKRKNTDDVFILSITRKLQKGMRESAWSGLNDLWIYKAFTYKCVQKREREKRGRE